MLNYIWLTFLLVAVIVGGFSGNLPAVTKGAFEAAEMAVMKIALPLVGIMAIWLGIMRLAERAGLVQIIARALSPIMRRLFPDVPRDHPAMGSMLMNIAANMLGLGNAATPLGLRAMADLERLNPRPGVATNAMCTFLAINTASVQLVPTTAIGLLAIAGSKNPTAVVPTAFLASACALTCGVLSARLLEKLPMFRLRAVTETTSADRERDETTASPVEIEKINPKPLNILGKIALIIFGLCFVAMFVMLAFPDFARNFASEIPAPPTDLEGKGPIVRSLFAISILAVPFLLSFFPLYAALRGVKVYEQFVEGAREAFEVAKRIIPFLVAMLVSISMLRQAGVIDAMTRALGGALAKIGFPVDLLPMVLMRPLSGSATQGIFVELINRLGPDSLTSRMAATIYGSTETTFYVLAVYFGSVAIRQTRHAVAAGLIADVTAVVAAIAICRAVLG
ncbi:MAG: nucleoside recognition domain-containing protein [Chthoniobacterales bacterium]